MADAKRDRQRLARQAKIEAELAAKKRAARQRQAIIAGALFVVLAAIVLIVNREDDEPTTVATDATTTLAATATTAPPPDPPPPSSRPPASRAWPAPRPSPPAPPRSTSTVGPPPTALVTKDVTVGTGDPVPDGSDAQGQLHRGVLLHRRHLRLLLRQWPARRVLAERRDPRLAARHPRHERRRQAPPRHPPRPGLRRAGRPGVIAPQETLWFVVEVLEARPSAGPSASPVAGRRSPVAGRRSPVQVRSPRAGRRRGK